MCLRIVTESSDSQLVDDIEEVEILEAIHRSFIGPGLSRDKRQERLFLGCEVPGCQANCMLVYDEASGEMLYETEGDGISIDPIPEENCIKLHPKQ
jgi:hypothetical protein